MGRQATGVKGIALRKGDKVVAGVVIARDSRQELLTVAENGYGKRTQVEHFRAQSRGGKGVINMRITPKTGKVVGAMMVLPSDELILLTSGGKIIRIGIAGISLVGRTAQGVRLVRMEDDQTVVCFDHVPVENGDMPPAAVSKPDAGPEEPEDESENEDFEGEERGDWE